MKRLMVGLATGVLLAAMLPGVASAADPVGGCPTGEGAGWTLVPAYFATPAVDNGNFADQNGDGYLCGKYNKGKWTSTWKDNTNPLPEP